MTTFFFYLCLLIQAQELRIRRLEILLDKYAREIDGLNRVKPSRLKAVK